MNNQTNKTFDELAHYATAAGVTIALIMLAAALFMWVI